MTATATKGLYRPGGEADPDSGRIHDIRPSDAGWEYVGFSDHRLGAGQGLSRPADDREVALIILEGQADVNAGDQRYSGLGSRESVFDAAPAPVLLLEPGMNLEVEASADATVIIADAPGAEIRRTALIEPADILVETRGSGVTERRIHHLLPPAAVAGRLILFEVYTPAGNWSSYPPHKHDTEDPPREAYLEELYYFRFARSQAWAFQRVYTPDRSLDEAFAAGDRDVVLVPRGYHPVGQPAGYDGYYLNVMAGHHRAWHFTIDPDHQWLMDWDPSQPH